MKRIAFARRLGITLATTLLATGLSGTRPAVADDQPESAAQEDAAPAEVEPAATDDEQLAEAELADWVVDPSDVFVESGEADFQLTSMQQIGPAGPAPMGIDVDDSSSSSSSSLAARLFGRAGGRRSLLAGNRRRRAGQPGTAIVLGSESRLRRSTDSGDLLQKSPSSLGVYGQRRSPIITNTRVRGGRVPTMLASGSYWFPARQDLDTLLSKIDSRIVEDLIIIKGPYSTRYGPGHTFVDFELLQSPRYENGYESHMSSSFDYSTNGEQFYGRQTFWGGSDNYGYRVGYGHKGGVDYSTGDGSKIPASYKSRDIDIALGFDLDADNSIEISYLRLDQTDTEIATQVFDFDFLKTDAVEVTYTHRNLFTHDSDELTSEVWFNQTRFAGDDQGSGKQAFMPQLSDPQGLGFIQSFTTAYNQSTGYTIDETFFTDEGGSVSIGTDFRYTQQALDEFVESTRFNAPSPAILQNFPIPEGQQVNPGLYIESETPFGELTIKSGARIDFVNSAATVVSDGPGPSRDPFNPAGLAVDDFDEEFFLFGGFITGEYRIDDAWTLNAGIGNSMRAPNMTELYTRGSLVTILPQFAGTTLSGNPLLKREKRYQIDLGVHVDEENVRAGLSGYHAWIHNFITLDFIGAVNDLNTGELLITNYQFTNTDLATLTGFEAYFEQDLNEWFTIFANTNFTDGRDHTRFETESPIALRNFGQGFRSGSSTQDEPLWAIAPLQALTGVRVQDPNNQWGLEFTANIVDNQDRFASSLLERGTPGYTTYDLHGFIRPTDNIMFVMGVENLTDKQYRTHFDPRNLANVFQPGINFFFGTEVTY